MYDAMKSMEWVSVTSVGLVRASRNVLKKRKCERQNSSGQTRLNSTDITYVHIKQQNNINNTEMTFTTFKTAGKQNWVAKSEIKGGGNYNAKGEIKLHSKTDGRGSMAMDSTQFEKK